MLPYDVICQLSHAMLDGTVFEIANGLRDIQRITEKNLHAKRTQLVNEHRGQFNTSLNFMCLNLNILLKTYKHHKRMWYSLKATNSCYFDVQL